MSAVRGRDRDLARELLSRKKFEANMCDKSHMSHMLALMLSAFPESIGDGM